LVGGHGYAKLLGVALDLLFARCLDLALAMVQRLHKLVFVLVEALVDLVFCGGRSVSAGPTSNKMLRSDCKLNFIDSSNSSSFLLMFDWRRSNSDRWSLSTGRSTPPGSATAGDKIDMHANQSGHWARARRPTPFGADPARRTR
jgi:hypothetical protein